MKAVETLRSHPEDAVEIRQVEAGHEINTPHYNVLVHHDSNYIDIYDSGRQLWSQLNKGSNLNLVGKPDVTFDFAEPTYETYEDGALRFTIESHGNLGVKRQVWLCRPEFIETYLEADIEPGERIENIEFFGGTRVGPNQFGTYMSQRHFEAVLNPQPEDSERRWISAYESTHITTSGMWQPGRRREYLITPFCLGFKLKEPEAADLSSPGKWLMTGISAPVKEQNMVKFAYQAAEDGFLLNMSYDKTKLEPGAFRSPSLLMHFAEEPLAGLGDYKRHAEELGHLPDNSPPSTADWHREPTLCTWGGQLERANLEPGVKGADFSTEEFAATSLKKLLENNIEVGKLIIDDKWQKEYGLNQPDPEKWSDIRRFIDLQHKMGRKVLLWMKLFDPEGLPAELCIVDSRGRPIASDPTNPKYLDALAGQVRRILSPDSLNADGLKIDFIAQLPDGPGLTWHGEERGVAALDSILGTISRSAYSVKPDSLLQAQITNPWLGRHFNQVRLNDSCDSHGMGLIDGMRWRAEMAKILLPLHSIDPDNWPMPSLEVFLRHIEAQVDVAGTVTIHYPATVNGEPLTEEHYRIIEEAVNRCLD